VRVRVPRVIGERGSAAACAAALRSNLSSFASRGPSTTRRSAMVRRRSSLAGLHAAARNLDLDKLKRILAAGADPNRVLSQGPYRDTTPLLVLCGHSWQDARTPAVLEAWARREEDVVACAAALIEAGADVNLRSRWIGTPLSLAAGGLLGDDCWRGYPMPRLVSLLIAAGADVTSAGRWVLKAAAESLLYYRGDKGERDAVRVISTLVDAGVDVRGREIEEFLPRPRYVGTDGRVRVPSRRTTNRVIAILLRAGAAVPELRPLVDDPALGYLRKVALSGGYKNYEQKCLRAFEAMLATKFPLLPEDVIPNIVLFAFHPGMYEIEWRMPPGALARIRDALLSRGDEIDEIRVSAKETRYAVAHGWCVKGSELLGRRVRVPHFVPPGYSEGIIRGWLDAYDFDLRERLGARLMNSAYCDGKAVPLFRICFQTGHYAGLVGTPMTLEKVSKLLLPASPQDAKPTPSEIDAALRDRAFTPTMLARLHASLDLPANASTTEFLGAVYDAAVEAGVNPMPGMVSGEYMSWTPPPQE
jgi:hypothetical protein